MGNWTDGNGAEIDYTAGLYSGLTPAFLPLLFLASPKGSHS